MLQDKKVFLRGKMPKKGYKQTEEHRRKLSKNLKERWDKPEFKESRSGKNHPLYGKHRSKVTRDKMSKSHTGKPNSEEHNRNISKSHIGILAGKNHPNFGKHLSKVTIEKISKSHKGMKFSDEHRKNISKSHKGLLAGERNPFFGKHHTLKTRMELSNLLKGKNHPNFGKHLSKVTRDKIGKANSGEKNYLYGKSPSETTRKRMSESHKGRISPMKGKHLSENHKRKIRKKSKEMWKKPGHKENMSKKLKEVWKKPGYKENMSGENGSMYGISPWSKGLTKETDERLKKKSESMKGENSPLYGKPHSPETIEKMSGENHYNYGKHHSLETRQIMVKNHKGMTGRTHTEETRKKIGDGNRGKIISEEHIKKMRENRAKQILPMKDTKIEVKIQNLLRQLGFDFFTHKYMKIEHSYQSDILIPSLNLVIECDGDAFHFNPKKYSPNDKIFKNGMTAQERWDLDNNRTKELTEKGFKVLRLWGSEINAIDLKGFEDIITKI